MFDVILEFVSTANNYVNLDFNIRDFVIKELKQHLS
jgi:hypothetical protein